VEEDIEVQSAQVGGVSSRRSRSRSGKDRLSSRKKREAPQPVVSGKNGAASKKELLALFRTVSSPTDYLMTDEMRHEVSRAENWTSRIANEDKVLAYGKEKTRTSDMKDTRARSSDEGDINQGTMDTVDRSIATLIGCRPSPIHFNVPVPDERKTQTTSRTSQSSNATEGQDTIKSRSRRPSAGPLKEPLGRISMKVRGAVKSPGKAPRIISKGIGRSEESNKEPIQ
jgi:hypothetical protein